jgi:hypothetical protein
MSAPAPDDATWTLTDVESELSELRDTIRMMTCLIHSTDDVEPAVWAQIRDRLSDRHAQLDLVWQAAWKNWQEQRAAHTAEFATLQAELEEEKNRSAAPGSARDIQHAEGLWALLRSAARVTMQECDKAPGARKMVKEALPLLGRQQPAKGKRKRG